MIAADAMRPRIGFCRMCQITTLLEMLDARHGVYASRPWSRCQLTASVEA